MPLKGHVRFRTRKVKGGRQRLAFRNNKVVEVKTTKRGRSKTRRPRR
jgi:hypothetical protein